jgi:ribose-phosphate pyrophosphokinase
MVDKFIVLTSPGIQEFSQQVVDGIRNLGGNCELSVLNISTFADQSNDVVIPVNVRKKNVYFIHTFITPNEGYIQLFLANDALKRASADRIVNVLPYIPYTRKDRKDRPRVPIAAKLFATLTECSGAERVITNDLHAGQIQGFYDIAVDDLQAEPFISEFIVKRFPHTSALVFVAPDSGATRIARDFAKRLNSSIAILDKRREKVNEVEVMNIIGDVSGKICILVDDMIDTGGTIVEGAKALKQKGALEVYAACTHAVFSEKDGRKAEERLLSEVQELMVTDSIPQVHDSDRITVVSLTSLYAEAIYRTQTGKSLSELFT